MLILFVIVLIIVSIVLGIIVLIQNPKGGGLSGSIAGFSNQFMGVKQTTDVLEKGTWIFAGIVGVLCIVSPIFIKKDVGSGKNDAYMNQAAPAKQAQPATTPATLPGAATTPDSPAKN